MQARMLYRDGGLCFCITGTASLVDVHAYLMPKIWPDPETLSQCCTRLISEALREWSSLVIPHAPTSASPDEDDDIMPDSITTDVSKYMCLYSRKNFPVTRGAGHAGVQDDWAEGSCHTLSNHSLTFQHSVDETQSCSSVPQSGVAAGTSSLLCAMKRYVANDSLIRLQMFMDTFT